MMPHGTVVYRDDTAGETVRKGPEMKFRLVHYGPLRPDKRGMDIRAHKQQLRRRFHRQLKELWARHATLQTEMTVDCFGNGIRPDQLARLTTDGGQIHLGGPNAFVVIGDQGPRTYPLLDIVQKEYSKKCLNQNGYVWVPLILNSYEVACELDIVLMFSGMKPGPLEFGDIDNRVKTLIDALRQPDPQNIVGNPTTNETPFFVLMQDDKLITKLAVETDQLYRPQPAAMARKSDDRIVHATITVTLRPYRINMFNLMFA